MPDSTQIEQLIHELADSSLRAQTLRTKHPVAQLLRRPGEQRWSAAECLEHLNLSNRAYLTKIDEALATLQERKAKSDGPFRLEWDARLLKYWLEPPSRLRLPTTAAFQPAEVKDAAATFRDFIALNTQLAERLESARGLDLSAAKITSPFAENVKYSVYSAFVLIGAHNRRHLWQAERALNVFAGDEENRALCKHRKGCGTRKERPLKRHTRSSFWTSGPCRYQRPTSRKETASF